ncbi:MULTISPECIES: hypothetical protein [unclassified Priestia]|uniref:hypothetical protein n=1 Tax=unclassified Priestia TaxID=2800374 RepID=UPI00366B55E4
MMEIVFADKSLTNERKAKIKNIIEREVKNFNLRLSHFGKLILIGERDEELEVLTELVKQDEADSIIELTKRSLGMRITDKENNSSVIISKPCWEGIASGEKGYQDFCIHAINHEFVHVHDHTIKYYDIYPESDDNRMVSVDDLNFIFRLKADEMWGEYLAERLSTPTVTDKFIWHTANNLELRLERMESLDKILVSFSMLLGIEQGLGDKCEFEIEGYVKDIVEDERLLQAWNYMKVELPRLFAKYPDWDNIDELDTLSDMLLNTWKDFDLL